MTRVSCHWLRRRETFSWKVCLYLYFAGMCYSMSTTFIYPFSLTLPFRWGGLLIFLNVYLWATSIYYEGVWLCTWRKTAGRDVKKVLSDKNSCQHVSSSMTLFLIWFSLLWVKLDFFFLCKVDIHVKLVETSSEWGFISLGKIEIAQNNDLKLRYWWNIASMQTGVIY